MQQLTAVAMVDVLMECACATPAGPVPSALTPSGPRAPRYGALTPPLVTRPRRALCASVLPAGRVRAASWGRVPIKTAMAGDDVLSWRETFLQNAFATKDIPVTPARYRVRLT